MPQVTGGLTQMLATQGAAPDVVKAASQIESMPGGSQLLYTVAAKKLMSKKGIPASRTRQLRLYCRGGDVKLARGGSTKRAAEITRRAGRKDDSILLHLAPNEYSSLVQMWGKPDINPDTGIPEYGWLSDKWDGLKHAVKKVVQSDIFKAVAPIALSIFVPGIGTAIGGAIGLSGTAASVAGNAILHGGLGAVTGGKEGALQGAVFGGVTGGLGKAAGTALGLTGKTANVVGSALAQGAGSELTGGKFGTGMIQGGLTAALQPTPVDAPDASAPAAAAAGAGSSPDVMGGIVNPMAATDTSVGPLPGLGGAGYTPPPVTPAKDWGKYAPLALAGLTAVGSANQGSYAQGKPPPMPEGWDSPLPAYSIDRSFKGLDDPADYYTYGQAGAPAQGQHLFFTPNPAGGLQAAVQADPALTTVAPAMEKPRKYSAHGGGVEGQGTSKQSRYVLGPGTGRSDDIDAKLSNGEYVMDAETVALLGDGSGDAGAQRLDEMRKELRKHKAKKLSKGEFSHKAKKPIDYIGGLSKLRRAATAAGRA